ncbi:hypothetical protein D9M72_653460 [compost metagenome]
MFPRPSIYFCGDHLHIAAFATQNFPGFNRVHATNLIGGYSSFALQIVLLTREVRNTFARELFNRLTIIFMHPFYTRLKLGAFDQRILS